MTLPLSVIPSIIATFYRHLPIRLLIEAEEHPAVQVELLELDLVLKQTPIATNVPLGIYSIFA